MTVFLFMWRSLISGLDFEFWFSCMQLYQSAGGFCWRKQNLKLHSLSGALGFYGFLKIHIFYFGIYETMYIGIS